MPQFPIRERDVSARVLIEGEANRSSARHAIVTGRQFTARRSLRAAGKQLILRQFARKIDKLTHMMIGVSRATEKNRKLLFGLGLAHCGIGLQPIFRGLLFDGFDYHRDYAIERRQHLGFWPGLGLREFAIAISYIVRARNACADVVIQIAGHVEKQMANGIAVLERPLPDLVMGYLIYPQLVLDTQRS